ncbi:MAG: hypothetical protein QG584_1685, partial [Pseudomonadota bacterium]|nr:hypothetical protein [Pseudomonadota bacterium]
KIKCLTLLVEILFLECNNLLLLGFEFIKLVLPNEPPPSTNECRK